MIEKLEINLTELPESIGIFPFSSHDSTLESLLKNEPVSNIQFFSRPDDHKYEDESAYQLLKKINGGKLYFNELCSITISLIEIFDSDHPLQRYEKRTKTLLANRLEKMKHRLIPYLQNPITQIQIKTWILKQRELNSKAKKPRA